MSHSALYQQLLTEAHSESLLDDNHQLANLLQIEGALALAQGQAQLIPMPAAQAIAAAAAAFKPAPDTLAAATANAGVVIPALVKALKQTLPEQHARWVHFGATSQDIVDSALILTLRQFIAHSETQLHALHQALATLARQHQHTLIAGRTRTQQAVPMSFGLKIANWLAPLLRQKHRLAQLKPRLLTLQLAGAVGTLSAMGDKGEQVVQLMAHNLALQPAPGWHTQRDNLVEFANWLALTTSALGKMATDWLWLGQSEVAEIRFSNGGGSSTMPQKCNPVNAEIIVALARHNAGAIGQMHQAMLQEHERSGSGWTLEWLTLPDMLRSFSVALQHSHQALAHLQVNREQMRRNLALHHQVIFAEPLTFILAQHMPRDQAQAQVRAACQQALASGQDLIELIQKTAAITISEAQLAQQLLTDNVTEHWLNAILADVETPQSDAK